MLNSQTILELVKCLDRVLDSNGRQKRHWEEQAVKKEVTFKAEIRAFMFSLKFFLEFQVEILDN